MIHINDARTATAGSGESMFDTSVAASSNITKALGTEAEPTSVYHGSGRGETLLATALVTIKSDGDQRVPARMLLDQGSELSFVRESIAQSLRLPRQRVSIPILGIESRSAGLTWGALSLRLCSRIEPGYEFDVLAHVLPNLTGSLLSAKIKNCSWPHVSGLNLADPSFASPGKIDIVLGADVVGRLLRAPIRKGSANQPVAQNTVLGWVLFGPTGKLASPEPNQGRSTRAFNCVPDYDLQTLLRRFWEQEEVPSPRTARMTAEEARCEEHFLTTHMRLRCGRYQVRLPFRNPRPAIGSSYIAAARMLAKMQRRFATDDSFARLYDDFLRKYEGLDHMSRLSNVDPTSSSSCYLPHHGVLRDTSATTKLRIVFNGSCRTANGVTLNDCLYAGPKLQMEIFDVLVRWRLHPYVFGADIVKMYRQIRVHPEDRKFQRILWSRSGAPVAYELNTVTYGLNCAPYLALCVLRQLAHEGPNCPFAIDIITREMYVDDVLSGVDCVDLARERAGQLERLLKAGGFALQKWTANDPAIIADIAPHHVADDPVREFHNDHLTRALGLHWRPSLDAFVVQPRLPTFSGAVTKCEVLARVA